MELSSPTPTGNARLVHVEIVNGWPRVVPAACVGDGDGGGGGASTSEKWKVRTWNLGQIFKTQLNLFTVISCSTVLHTQIYFIFTDVLLDAHQLGHGP